MARELSIERRQEIITLSSQGLPARRIARMVKCSHTTVINTLKRYQETGKNQSRLGRGRKKMLTQRNERFIEREVLLGRADNAVQVKKKLENELEIVVSPNTVRRALKRRNFHAFLKVKKLYLSKKT